MQFSGGLGFDDFPVDVCIPLILRCTVSVQLRSTSGFDDFPVDACIPPSVRGSRFEVLPTSFSDRLSKSKLT
jgi:hypothetical protein